MTFADKVFHNGRIDTQDRAMEDATAFAVKEDKFLGVGSYKDMKKYISPDTELIDLQQKRVVPGFNDSHMHYLGYCMERAKADLRGTKSISQLQQRLREHTSSSPWILGSGWNDTYFEEMRIPNRYDLDQVYPDRPVFLSRICYHICVVNSKALELAGIGPDTKDPEGGKIDRDPITNQPTGILRENAVYLVFNMIPKPSGKEEIKELLMSGVEDALVAGLTSIQSDDFEYCHDYHALIDAYRELSLEGKLPIRFNLQVRAKSKEAIRRYSDDHLFTGQGDNNIKIGPIKIMADGSLGSRTAAMEQPYNDKPDTRGILIHEPQELRAMAKQCKNSNFQMAVHAIGDRAMNVVLDAFEDEEIDNRPRIIHCQITNNDILRRFEKLRVIADIQPAFVSSDYGIVEKRVGREYAKGTYAWKTMLESGIRVSGSSDCPIENFNPIHGIYGAVTRKDLEGSPEGGWLKEQCLEVREAISIYTKGSAYACFEENIKGTITVGKLADFLILSDDIYGVDKDHLMDVQVDETYIGGKRVYSRRK